MWRIGAAAAPSMWSAGWQANGRLPAVWVGERLHTHRAFYWNGVRAFEGVVLAASVQKHAGRRRMGERMGELVYKQAG